eukprot:COSAG04_NODE_1810_length_5515_cov_6.783419_7_plen_78_part_00
MTKSSCEQSQKSPTQPRPSSAVVDNAIMTALAEFFEWAHLPGGTSYCDVDLDTHAPPIFNVQPDVILFLKEYHVRQL